MFKKGSLLPPLEEAAPSQTLQDLAHYWRIFLGSRHLSFVIRTHIL